MDYKEYAAKYGIDLDKPDLYFEGWKLGYEEGVNHAVNTARKAGTDASYDTIAITDAIRKLLPSATPYHELDHYHCWQQGKSPACGIPLGKHEICCLCAIPKRKKAVL